MKPRGRKNIPSSDVPREEVIQEQIQRRAYERFMQRGGRHGFHMEDWLEAEREVRAAKKSRPTARTRKVISRTLSRPRSRKGETAEGSL